MDDTYDQLLKILKEEAGPNIENLSEFDKAYTLALWVDANIAYSQKNRSRNTMEIVKRRYGACSEIAFVYRDAAIALGLEANTIRSTNHEWNVVKIDGKWYEVDGKSLGFYEKGTGVYKGNKKWIYHPTVQTWVDLYHEYSDIKPGVLTGYSEEFWESLEDSRECYHIGLKERLGHDQVDLSKYEDIFADLGISY